MVKLMVCTSKLGVACFLAVIILLTLAQAPKMYAIEQANKPLSFITDALALNEPRYSISGGSESAYASYINETNVIMNSTGYRITSENSNLSISCDYPSNGDGLWFVTLTIDRASTELPLCIQPSANVVDRARDFLTKYQNWTGNSSLTEVTSMLDNVDATKNMTVTNLV